MILAFACAASGFAAFAVQGPPKGQKSSGNRLVQQARTLAESA
jgi:hypothetical protein